MKKTKIYTVLFNLLLFPLIIYAETGYKIPSENITRVFNTARLPYLSFTPETDLVWEMNYEPYAELEDLADERLQLAGVDFSRKLNAPRDRRPVTSLNIRSLNDGRSIQVDFGSEIRIRDYKISPDKQWLALSYETERGIELVLVETSTGNIQYIDNLIINDILEDTGFWWEGNSQQLLCKTVPEDRSSPPLPPAAPSSPILEETEGKFNTSRTYQNVLKNGYDEVLFDHYFTSQLVILNIRTGKPERLGEPCIIIEVAMSPNGSHLLIDRVTRPYSYELPYYRFPRTFEIWNREGKIIRIVHQRPLQDQVPIGGTYTGPRNLQWLPQQPATIIWTEALDNGDPRTQVDHRDKLMALSSPFQSEPRELIRTEYRLAEVLWSETENDFIIREYDRERLWERTWYIRSEIGNWQLLSDQSINDIYNRQGNLVMTLNKSGNRVFLHRDNYIYYNNISGATPEGSYPYLARYNLLTEEKEILFRCQPEHYERFYGFLSSDMQTIAIGSETPQTPRNYYKLDLTSGTRSALTDYQNPYTEISGLEKELIKYQRDDGVMLSATLYLPPGFQSGDTVPLVIYAYPEEYTDSTTAGQVDSSPFRFTGFYGSSPIYLALAGYAVLMNAAIPIIGDPEIVNETFISQTVSSVQAAIDELAARELIDPDRVGIVGHSYGAFMVANILAHSDLCAAGIALSGAYNRSLTPFGFQSERRTLWQAKDFYIKVSPFFHADQIKEPLLLIHGENDPNSGTFPLQSRRFYQALQGTGGTARLCLLPLEGHNYSARESHLHVLAEMIDWFDRFLIYNQDDN
ncbi:MAG: S9 family peptidase [Candidatus Cloacimonetes bacterium]|nr:S9 family peptidase [Candidatus Cloacimonadota bacterium]